MGPTDSYSRHVQTVVDRLTGSSDRVMVLDLPALMRTILRLSPAPITPVSQCWRDAAAELALFARAAVARLRVARERLKSGDVTPLKVDEVYEYLRRNGSGDHPLTRDPEWAEYLWALPPITDPRTRYAHLSLLATIQWEIAKHPDLIGIEHIIVDEAQDVTPLEWMLLATINEAHAWTIIGDLNQRRSDHTFGSWKQVFELLAIPYGDPPICRLDRGYRSTRPILRFANRLLPAAQRSVRALQEDGPEPVVEKCQSGLDAALIRQLHRLRHAYPTGTVAIITMKPTEVQAALRREGWGKAGGDTVVWQHAEHGEVTVAHPNVARGLEFDAVIVVEPADFPQNLGRHGLLYTALTPANRELVVLHTKPLPDKLRKR